MTSEVKTPSSLLLENDGKETKENDVSENTSSTPTYKEDLIIGRVRGKDG
jgi:hypothetical protein